MGDHFGPFWIFGIFCFFGPGAQGISLGPKLGLTWPGLAWPCLAWLAWLGLFCLAWLVLSWPMGLWAHGPAQAKPAHPTQARPGLAQNWAPGSNLSPGRLPQVGLGVGRARPKFRQNPDRPEMVPHGSVSPLNRANGSQCRSGSELSTEFWG